jgi:hypothetical protein
MSYKWFPEQEGDPSAKKNTKGKLTQTTFLNNGKEGYEIMGIPPAAPVQRIPRIICSDKVFKTEYEMWENKFIQVHPDKPTYSEQDVMDYIKRSCDYSFEKFIDKSTTVGVKRVIAISLKETKGLRSMSVIEYDDISDMLSLNRAFIETVYTLDQELCLETIHKDGVDYTFIREWRTHITDKEKETVFNAIMDGSEKALDLLDSNTWRISYHFNSVDLPPAKPANVTPISTISTTPPPVTKPLSTSPTTNTKWVPRLLNPTEYLDERGRHFHD